MRRIPLLLLLAACSEREFQIQNVPQPTGDLTISGRVCDPITRVFVEGALVYTHLYDDNDIVYATAEDTTGADGGFVLEGLVGGQPYEVYTQIGRDVVDKLIVELGETNVVLPTPACGGDIDLEVAVISGTWDDLEPILVGAGVGGVVVIDGQSGTEVVDFLTDPSAMAAFDMILFDGGHREDGVIYGSGPVDEIRTNIADYVDGGGAVLASDWAYDVVEAVWPDRVDFHGDDTVPDAAQIGEPGSLVASVADPELAEVLGSMTVQIVYDVPVWPLIESVDGTVHLDGDAPWRVGLQTGTVPSSPLLVSFDEGLGRVIVTTYRNSVNTSAGMLGVIVTMLEGVEALP